MVTRFFICLLILAIQYLALAQVDTVFLSEVSVVDTYDRYLDQGKREALDSTTLDYLSIENLGATLQRTSGIYIRQYGAEGQLSSVSFRGTTPNHTVVGWNGININSPTLGQSDFSSIPTFLFSDIELFGGGNSAVNGSGAIGGTINLESNHRNNYLHVSQQLGSFGKYFTGFKGAIGGDQWRVGLAAVHSQIENGFDVNFRGETYEQNNAASLLQAGILSAHFRQKNWKYTADIWYNHHDRETQPIIGDMNSDDVLIDDNLRVHTKAENGGTAHYFSASLSFVDDRQQYNETSAIIIKRWIGQTEYEFLGLDKTTIKSGLNAAMARADVSSFESNARQGSLSWFVYSRHALSDRIDVTGNLRIPYQEHQKRVPLIPSITGSFELIGQARCQLVSDFSVSRNFRFPTLNDLYWEPGGNKNLKPEDALNTDLGLEWQYSADLLELKLGSNLYQSWIDDMIVWVPQGNIWTPDNVRKVKITGGELTAKARVKWPKSRLDLITNYSYNKSENESGNQLAYVPLHKAGSILSLTNNGWGFIFQHDYTGLRFTELSNTSSMEGYQLTSVQLSKSLKFSESELSFHVGVNNLWDKDYQNYELRATPGRNFYIKLNYKLIKS